MNAKKINLIKVFLNLRAKLGAGPYFRTFSMVDLYNNRIKKL